MTSISLVGSQRWIISLKEPTNLPVRMVLVQWHNKSSLLPHFTPATSKTQVNCGSFSCFDPGDRERFPTITSFVASDGALCATNVQLNNQDLKHNVKQYILPNCMLQNLPGAAFIPENRLTCIGDGSSGSKPA